MGMTGGDKVLHGIHAKRKCRLKHVPYSCEHTLRNACGSSLWASSYRAGILLGPELPTGQGPHLPVVLKGPGPGGRPLGEGGLHPAWPWKGGNLLGTGFKFNCFSDGLKLWWASHCKHHTGRLSFLTSMLPNPHVLYFLRRKCVIWLPSSLRTHANN